MQLYILWRGKNMLTEIYSEVVLFYLFDKKQDLENVYSSGNSKPSDLICCDLYCI